MRVLHLISSLDPAAGGVSQAVRTIISGLQPLGVKNEVASADAPGASFLQEHPFPLYPLGPSKTAWMYSAALLPWLKTNIDKYDAVIVHGLWQYQTAAAYKAWKGVKGKKPKLLVMPHGMLDPYFQRAKGRKIKAIRNKIFWMLTEGRLINNADGLLFTCETEKLLAREPFAPYHPKQEWVTGLGIEPPPPYTPAMQNAFAQKLGKQLPPYWLYISRIHEKKGVDLLIESYLALQQSGAILPPLVIAGPGLDTPYGQQIKALANHPSIYFPGMLTGDAKWGAFYGCETFILPSHQENFGIAVVEALACGKPVLISDQVNIWREIVEGGAGISEADTLEGTKNLLKKWTALSAAEKGEIANRTVPAFKKYFSLEAVSQKLFAVLKG